MEKKKKMLPWIVLAIAWISPIIFFWIYGENYLDSDMASEMVLAKLLNDEGKFLSANWFYSSEIRIICQEFFFKLWMKIFPNNWHLVRTAAQATQLLLVVISYLYMTSIFKNREKNIYFAAILMCPFGFWQMFHNSFGGFYLMHMVFFMLSAGVMFKLCLYENRRVLRVIFLTLLCFEQGLSGVRMMMNLYAPMVLAAVLILYARVRDLDGKVNKEDIKRELRLLVTSVYGIFVALIGYVVNLKVLQEKYSFHDYSTLEWDKLSITKLATTISTFLRVFGYPAEDVSPNREYLLTPTGILSAFSLVLIGIVILSMFRIGGRVKKLNLEERLVAFTCYCSVIVTILVFTLFKSDYNGSYFLPVIPGVFALISIEWETEKYYIKIGKQLAALVLAFSILACSISTTHGFLQSPPRAIHESDIIVKAILDKGYTQGIATFWNSNIFTELSDGQIEMWTIQSYESHELYPWLQRTSHSEGWPKGKGVFILNDETAYKEFILTFPGSELIYDGQYTKVIGVSDIEMIFQVISQL